MHTYQYNRDYQIKINLTIRNTLKVHNRITACRIDLRFPTETNSYLDDSGVITRFIESLKAKIKAFLIRKYNHAKRTYHFKLFYVWVREFGVENQKKHYHLLLLINKDIFYTLGDYKKTENTLYAMLQQAWSSALSLDDTESHHLVHIPDNAITWLNNNSASIERDIELLNQRCNYLAKEHTKYYADGERSFGCSR